MVWLSIFNDWMYRVLQSWDSVFFTVKSNREQTHKWYHNNQLAFPEFIKGLGPNWNIDQIWKFDP